MHTIIGSECVRVAVDAAAALVVVVVLSFLRTVCSLILCVIVLHCVDVKLENGLAIQNINSIIRMPEEQENENEGKNIKFNAV